MTLYGNFKPFTSLYIDHLKTLQIALGIRNPLDTHHVLEQTNLLHNY